MLWQAAKPITKINIEQFNIGKADHSKLNTQNSTFDHTSSSANFTLKPSIVANIISISFQNE